MSALAAIKLQQLKLPGINRRGIFCSLQQGPATNPVEENAGLKPPPLLGRSPGEQAGPITSQQAANRATEQGACGLAVI